MPAVECLSRKETSAYIRANFHVTYAVSTLAKLASQKKGPPYKLVGPRAVYPVQGIHEWIERNTVAKVR